MGVRRGTNIKPHELVSSRNGWGKEKSAHHAHSFGDDSQDTGWLEVVSTRVQSLRLHKSNWRSVASNQ